MTEDRAISLNAVLEKAVYTETEEGWCGYTVDVDYIKSLPPVTPNDEEMAMQYQRGYIDGFKEGKATFEPKPGHWIDLREDNEMSDDDTWRYSCNMCHSQNFRKTLFCPNCGCAMVESQEGAKNEIQNISYGCVL